MNAPSNINDWLDTQQSDISNQIPVPVCHCFCTPARSVAGGRAKLCFLKWFSSCTFLQLIQDSVLLFLLLIQEKAEGGKKNKENIQSRVGERERGLGFHWVDWRGFGPLNRSTCSSGISRRRSSILVEWGCLPITPWVLMGAWVWRRFLVLSFGLVVCEDLLCGLIPGYCWHRCPDQLEEVLPSLSKCH